MLTLCGVQCGSHITGQSTRNQRIERFWRDVFENCLDVFYSLFYILEDNGILDVENDMHCTTFMFQESIAVCHHFKRLGIIMALLLNLALLLFKCGVVVCCLINSILLFKKYLTLLNQALHHHQIPISNLQFPRALLGC